MEQTVAVVQQGRGERECHSSPGGLGMEAEALKLVGLLPSFRLAHMAHNKMIALSISIFLFVLDGSIFVSFQKRFLSVQLRAIVFPGLQLNMRVFFIAACICPPCLYMSIS